MHKLEARATKPIKTWLISVLEVWKIGIWKRAIHAIKERGTIHCGNKEKETANS